MRKINHIQVHNNKHIFILILYAKSLFQVIKASVFFHFNNNYGKRNSIILRKKNSFYLILVYYLKNILINK